VAGLAILSGIDVARGRAAAVPEARDIESRSP
jgi:hypothetical protein